MTASTRNEAADLLAERIAESGLSQRQFALRVLLREPRTIARWIARDSPIPAVVSEWLADPTAPPWPRPHPSDAPDRKRVYSNRRDAI